jgi:hypothetical protein
MGMVRNRVERSIIQSELGQTATEYILLFAVVFSLVNFVFQSDTFQSIFGKNGKVTQNLKGQVEFSYRHGFYGTQNFSTPNYAAGHESYRGKTYGTKDPYPSN